MRIKLYDFSGSPFCVKIRAILDYKALDYERLPIVSTRFLELRRRNPTGKVPAIEIDGTFIADSTDIAHALDQRCPTPPLFPGEAKLRAFNHVLEDWADEALYFLGLHHRWQDEDGRREASTVFPAPVAGIVSAAVGRAARQHLHAQGVGRKSAEQVATDLDRALESIAALVDTTPYLLGDAPYLCDFSVMGQLVYLVRTPAGEKSIARFAPVMRYLDRMKALRVHPPSHRASA